VDLDNSLSYKKSGMYEVCLKSLMEMDPEFLERQKCEVIKHTLPWLTAVFIKMPKYRHTDISHKKLSTVSDEHFEPTSG
jgi:hypothetical protein